MTQEKWNQEYASGHWNGLHRIHEAHRYGILSAYLTHLGAAQILDVGCGDGLLRHHWNGPRYAGLDISNVALAKAKERFPKDAWIQGDFGKEIPEDLLKMMPFDAVLWNEVLYYLDLATAFKHWNLLCPSGHLLVSMQQNQKNFVSLEALKNVLHCEVLVKTQVENLAWDLAVFRRK